MTYFFILGTNPALSAAELLAVLALKKPRLLAPDFLIADLPEEIEAPSLIRHLGGTVKIGRLTSSLPVKAEAGLLNELISLVQARQAASGEGKFNFGISDYGLKNFNKKDLGLKLKKHFSEAGVSARFVISREKTLSSVVVEQNRLLKRGIEIILAMDRDTILIGETLAVQPFKDLSLRDYGRPARDDRSGMLPPKLAQIMINLARRGGPAGVLVDPFCGSGTILSEAMLMGYTEIFGSDISPKAVEDSRTNCEWVRELYKIEGVRLKIMVRNALSLSSYIKPASADAIVTEPFLGPQRGRIDFQAVSANLEKLYSGALVEFNRVLKPGGRVVMVWPSFYGQRPISPDHPGLRIVPILDTELLADPRLKMTDRQTIIYGRPGQKVYREIVCLEKV